MGKPVNCETFFKIETPFWNPASCRKDILAGRQTVNPSLKMNMKIKI